MNEALRNAMVLERRAQAAFQDADPSNAEDYTEKRSAFEAARDKVVKLLEDGAANQTDPPQELADRVEVRRYLQAYAEQRSVDGAEAELNQELKLNAENQIPVAALAPFSDPTEKRADAPTVATDIKVGTAPVLARVFKRSDIGFLGIPMPMVPAGTARYPYLTAGVSGALRKEGVSVDAAAANFATEDLKPVRVTARYRWGVETAAALGEELESALRNDLREALADSMDLHLLTGNVGDNDASQPAFKGVQSLLGAAVQVNGGSKDKAATFDAYKMSVVERVDAQYTLSEEEVRVLLGLATYRHARGVYHTIGNNNFATSLMDAFGVMRDVGAMVQASAKIAAASAATNSDGSKQGAVVSGRPDSLIAPVWAGLTVVRDPYTHSDSGEIAMTAHLLFNIGQRRGTEGNVPGWKALEYVISDKS